MLQRLLALTTAIWHNETTNRPGPARSLTAYDYLPLGTTRLVAHRAAAYCSRASNGLSVSRKPAAGSRRKKSARFGFFSRAMAMAFSAS